MTPEEFLAARLDEDEAAAKRCAEVFPSPWDVVDRGCSADVKADEPDFRVVTALDERKVPKREGSWWLSEYLEHIARHDPARALRQIKALRTLLEDHSGRHVCEDTMAGGHWDDDLRDMVADPCRVLRVILEVWNDHPDYDAKWHPDYDPDLDG